MEQANPANQTHYGWDSRNRLTGITGPGLAASFQYDALGRRTARTVNGQSTRYVYDGLQAIAEIGAGGTSMLLTGLGSRGPWRTAARKCLARSQFCPRGS